MSSIAMIGTGAIGSRLCGHLVRNGHLVTAFDPNESAIESAVARGARRAPSPGDAVREAEYCILAVRDGRDVEEVVLGRGGIAAAIPPGGVVIDTTSSDPSVTRRVGSALASHGVQMLDAPVSRGVEAAERGTLSVMVGGDPRVLERCRPIIDAFGSDVYYAGPLGCGHAAKALNMVLLGVAMTATAEILAVARGCGIPEETALSVLNASSANSYASSFHFPRFVLTKTFDSTFTIGLMEKDLRIALDMAKEVGMQTPMLQRLVSLYGLALERLGPAADNTRISRYSEALARGR